MNTEELLMRLPTAPAGVVERVAAILDGKQIEADTGDRRLLSFSAAAVALGVSRTTVWRAVRDGRLQSVEVRAGRRRVPSAALTALLAGKGW